MKLVIAIGLSLMVLPSTPIQAERSPIFASASIQPLSIEAARDITARGFWADYYGAAGVTHAYNAYIFAYYARYFAVSNSVNETNWYNTASVQAYYASVYLYYAAYYSAAGM